MFDRPSLAQTLLEERLQDQFCAYARSKDTAALGDAFVGIGTYFQRIARRAIRCPQRADDAVQATFLEAMLSVDRFDLSRPVVPWLRGILNHQILKAEREAMRAGEVPRVELRPEPAPDQVAERRETEHAFSVALQSLPERYRTVVELRIVQGMRVPDIADRVRKPAGTAKTLLRRGLSMLRTAMGE